MPRKIEISHRTIIFTVILLVGLWFLYYLRDIILSVFVALLITAIINPVVKKLSKYKIPRGFSVLIVYISFFVILGVAIASIIPPLIKQTTSFAASLPSYLENLKISSEIANEMSKQFILQLGNLPSQVVGFSRSLVENIFAIITVLIFAFYFLLARNKLESDGFNNFFGNKVGKEITSIIDELEVKLGGWARGQLALMITVGSFSYLGYSILGIPFALPLGILAGFFEIIPYLGPVLGAAPAVIIGFGISPIMGVATLVLALLIQQLENYVLVPKIMERSVGVSPIITLISLSIGLRLAGIVGVVLSVPVVLTLDILAKRRFSLK